MALSFVVGYQNLDVVDIDAGGNSWLVSTLPTVGKNLEANTLGDLKVAAPEGGFVSEFSVQVFTYTDAGQVDGEFLYLDENSNGAAYGVESGWYTADSVADWDPVACDNEILAFGRGFNVLSDCGATITCAGEVLKTAVSVEIVDLDAGGNTWTGNCSPVNRTLADFAITPPEGGLTSEFSVQVFTYTDAGQVDGEYLYLDENSNGAAYGVESGWYTADSVAEWDPVDCGSTPIAAGRMINILSDCGATLTIPSAL